MDAIIYTTNTGSTGQYAKLLAQETGLPAYSLAEAKKRVFAGAEVVYLAGSWPVRSRGVPGLRSAIRCALSAASAWDKPERRQNSVPEKVRNSSQQFRDSPCKETSIVKKLHGIYRFMMEIMVKTVGKGLAAKKDRTPEEDDMLDMMLHGGERIKAENLSAILDWYRAQQ